ncbi:MAG: hypothetical protein SGI98_10230 [Verrucomicrobiota bacterium]|nr:hypothetical protein [Verrucomicrobiota bacterium]
MAEIRTLEALYERHSQRLYSFLTGFLRNEGDTKDVLPQVFLKLARKGDLLDGADDEAAFFSPPARA